MDNVNKVEDKKGIQKELKGLQKAAALLIALGPDACSKIFKAMETEEVEMLAAEITKIHRLDSDTMTGLLEEFHSLVSVSDVSAQGGLAYATTVLNKALGSENAMNAIDRIRENVNLRPFEQLMISSGSSDMLTEMLKDEHPQTIALVLSHVKEQRAAQILSALPPELQTEVIVRIATMKRVSPEIISQIEESLREKSTGHESVSTGGIKTAANILNRADIDVEKRIMESVAKIDSKLAESISDLMFTYDDIVLITDVGMQKLIQMIDENDLLMALKASTDEIKAKFMKNMSERRRQGIQDDLAIMPPVRLKDVQAAQGRILGIAKDLIQSGAIEVVRDSVQEVFI